MHICIAHGHRQQCGEGQEEGGGWMEGGKGGKEGTSVIVNKTINKTKTKIKNSEMTENQILSNALAFCLED